MAEQTFQQYIKEAQVNVLYQYQVISAVKENNKIKEISLQDAGDAASHTTRIVKAKVFIDCSYEGDLMAKAGVSYTTGREANSMYNELYNGVQLRDKHQFKDSIDPYIIPGKPGSGLLWGISSGNLAAQGSGDKLIQAYNFRICLTNKKENAVAVTRPTDYDSLKYELLLRILEKNPAKSIEGFLNVSLMPNSKTDINNNGPFSTDMIGMNYDYTEADYGTRKKIQQAHENYIKGLLYFIGHDTHMPAYLRDEMLQWGYPKDEYVDNNHWSPQMYVREARRMVGEYVMTQANCEGKEKVTDGVGMAAYTMDSHNCQRLVVNGMVKNEGDVQMGGFGPYPVSYRCIIPKASDCSNLLVPVCLSASHIAYGSIRMEPVFMVLAQSAATAAVMAVEQNETVQAIDVLKLQEQLKTNPLADGSTPEILVDNDDSLHVTIKGNWKAQTKGCYGPSMLIADDKNNDEKLVRFTPAIKKTGNYHVYSYLPKLEHLASQIKVTIFDSAKKQQHNIIPADVKVEGQTSGEWIDLGTYHLNKGNSAYAEINCKGADGTVVADAVLFIPEQ